MNNSYITIIKEKRTVLSRKRVPRNQNECTADFGIGVPFEQNLHVYYIELNNIIAPDLEKAHIFTAGNITVSNYSALSYVNKALDSEKSSENNKKTAAALYLYWKAAEAYFS